MVNPPVSSVAGVIALMQIQEDMKQQLSEKATEEELEQYMESHKKVMVNSLWKLNVADIEATLGRVCLMVGPPLSLSLRPALPSLIWSPGAYDGRFSKRATSRERSSVPAPRR